MRPVLLLLLVMCSRRALPASAGYQWAARKTPGLVDKFRDTFTRKTASTTESTGDPAQRLLATLRGQLVSNNYDYEGGNSTEEPSTPPPKQDRANNDQPSRESILGEVNRNVLNGYISELSEMDTKDKKSKFEMEANNGDVSTKRLATSMDEWFEVINPAPGAPVTARLSYKLLTARGNSGRRSGGGPRYLQAALNDTVLVAPLDVGPLPDFRLPKSRRQYREDSYGDDVSTDSGDPAPAWL